MVEEQGCFRERLDSLIASYPELFPRGIELGYQLYGLMRPSAKLPEVQVRRISLTTPVWKPVVEPLKNLEPGGRLVINAIGKEEADKDYLLRLDYPTHLWLEKEIKSVAHVSRSDVSEFLALAAEMRSKPNYQEFALEEANQALAELKRGEIRGAKVLRIG